MFDEFKEKIISFFTSRLTIFTLVFLILGGILIYRCFDLQIVHGEEYLENFVLETEKTRDIASTRGNIYDRNGNVLAYNELAYSVKIEDVFESGRKKNANLNETVLKLIHMIERNGDHVITDFKIMLNEDGEFAFTVEGTSLLRFLADVYGKKTVGELDDEMKASTAEEVLEFLSEEKFAIGEYEDPEDTKSDFIPGRGYSREDWLKLVTIRYAMDLTSYRKYIGTTVATDVSEKTVAVIMENSQELPGVTIVEDTVRKYVDSKYFAHLLGYTGKISSDELTALNAEMEEQGKGSDVYNINDVVGKGGIESAFETTLQGVKGYERVVVDNMGKVISIEERKEAQAGQDVYLTIDMELTKAVYNILEQKLAGLVSEKIINAKEYKAAANAGSSDIKIPIYDVYFAMFNNSIIDVKHMASENAGETETAVYQAYLAYKEQVYEKLIQELTESRTPYKKLSKEYQTYESNIVTLLNRNGVIITEAVDANDPTQIAWVTDEVISLNEYLKYCISKNWIDVSKLSIDDKYSDSAEIYDVLLDYIIAMIDKNTEFQKRFYKYMLLSDTITGKQVCMILCEQMLVEIPPEDESALYNGKLSAYNFMKNRIDSIDITPAQLALDPCNASCIITDTSTGDILAMVSYPGYDNNKMANSVDAEYFAKLNADKANPQWNYATQSALAPGSTFKMVTATAGLMEGVISLRDKFTCVGTFTEIEPSPRCWRRSGHGNETLTTAIRDSCNYYFYNVGYRLSTRNGVYNDTEGLNTLYEYADLYGLTEKSGIEIAEAAPNVSTLDAVRSAIGQGSNSYTTVGIARYVTTVANSGTCFNLTLLDKVTDREGNLIREPEPDVRNVIEMPGEYWDAIHKGMRQVVQNKVYFADLAVEVAGKTGTAEQVSSRPSHALFVCYAPYEQPEIAIATRIPFGYSSDHAAQATRNIIMYYYGLAEEDELITGEADAPEEGISNEL
ncbi:MAG: penicillin-binding transpeptidase domain-containing protein [Butyrivibrio sp.]|nr:penicillin-binding transpeptidase domain-containing protein [Acetatifactor muris]MCM1557944.1 penicillin-binding transpeptidase domain-containing protein [Butyrivibrio sp.]